MYESETNEIERRWKQGSQTFYPKAIEILLARIHWLEEAAQQSVQADENTAEAFIANFIEFINDVYLHEEDRQKVLGFLRQRSRR